MHNDSSVGILLVYKPYYYVSSTCQCVSLCRRCAAICLSYACCVANSGRRSRLLSACKQSQSNWIRESCYVDEYCM